MRISFILTAFCVFQFLFYSIANASTFEKNFGTIIPTDYDFKPTNILLTCDINHQKGFKNFQSYFNSEYVWGYQSHGNFFGLLFGYRTPESEFIIEVVEVGLDGRPANYYFFDNDEKSHVYDVLASKVTGHKKRNNSAWFDCTLNANHSTPKIQNSQPQNLSKLQMGRIRVRLEAFHSLQDKALEQFREANHPMNLYLDIPKLKKRFTEQMNSAVRDNGNTVEREPQQTQANSVKRRSRTNAKLEVAEEPIFQNEQKSTADSTAGDKQLLEKHEPELAEHNKYLLDTLFDVKNSLKQAQQDLRSMREAYKALEAEKRAIEKVQRDGYYDPAFARTLLYEDDYGYLQDFEKMSGGLNTTEQIVNLMHDIMREERENERLHKLLRSQNNELGKLGDFKRETLLALGKPYDTQHLDDVNWDTDCRIYKNKIKPIKVYRFSIDPASDRRYACLQAQYTACFDMLVNGDWSTSDHSEFAEAGSTASYDARLMANLHLNENYSNEHVLATRDKYQEANRYYELAIKEIQDQGISCSGPIGSD